MIEHTHIHICMHKQTTEGKTEGLPHHPIMIMTFTDARHVLVCLNHLPQCQLCHSFFLSFSIPCSLLFLEANLESQPDSSESVTLSHKINCNPWWCFRWSNVALAGGVGVLGGRLEGSGGRHSNFFQHRRFYHHLGGSKSFPAPPATFHTLVKKGH